MGKVTTGLTMSLDGFIAGPNDGPGKPLGEGGMRLFDWFSSGDARYEWPGNDMVARVSAASAALLDEAMSATGALVTGRRTFEIVINLVPVLLGDGVRLFDHLGIEPTQLENIRVVEGTGVTHLHFRVIK